MDNRSDPRIAVRGGADIRLSVRGLIVVVLLVGAGLGWVAREGTDPARRVTEGRSCHVVHSFGYDWQFKDGPSPPMEDLLRPEWLVSQIGIDYFGQDPLCRIPPAR